MTIDPWSAVPIYRQLASILRERIVSGEIQPGGPLPSELRLQQEHGLARDTVRAAVRLLRGEGLVVTLSGRGSFVPPDYRPPAGHR
jgi:DNA-binding GntR family transcriptional regulator